MRLIGSLLDALSYPRRMAWSALGLPEHGSDILGHLGFDPNEGATKLLGSALEIAGDPLAIAGGPLFRSLTGGEKGSSMGAMNPALAASLDDVLLASVNGRGTNGNGQEQQKPVGPPLHPQKGHSALLHAMR